MDRDSAIEYLKKYILHDIGYLCRRVDRLWIAPIVRTLRDIQQTQNRAVFFGGTLRSLLISRVRHGRLGRPRDVDIVVDGVSVDTLRESLQDMISRETRFGGLKLRRMNWEFDVWPLHKTWAFVKDGCSAPAFEALPFTTFFNLEAIAVDVWAAPGSTRRIYSGDDQFFDGIISQTIDLNREENPFPALCVVRALIMASALDFSIGPRLARYLATHGPEIANVELEGVQHKHYGRLRHDARTMRTWIEEVQRCIDRNDGEPVRLRVPRQLSFWPQERNEGPSARLRMMALAVNHQKSGTNPAQSVVK